MAQKGYYVRRWLVVSASLALVAVLLVSPAVRAHEVITDATHQANVVLHVEPDDTPVAGTKSSLEFIAQGLAVSSATLRINDSFTPVVVTSDGAIRAEYNFPVEGVYVLRLDVVAKKNSQHYTFTHSLQVARGTKSNQRYEVAVAGGISITAAMLTLGAVAWRRRENLFNNRR